MLPLVALGFLGYSTYIVIRAVARSRDLHGSSSGPVSSLDPEDSPVGGPASAEPATSPIASTPSHHQQFVGVVEPKSENRDVDQSLNRLLLVGVVGLGLSGIGAITLPAAGLLSVPFTLYGCSALFKQGYQSIAKEHRLRAQVIDSMAVCGALLTHQYFATALMNMLFLTSRKLLVKTENHTRQKLVSIFDTPPHKVWILKDGAELEVAFDAIQPGDILVMNAGQVIPVDGLIHAGSASIDQHMLTGESRPIEKGPGDQVFAATVILAGRVHVVVEKSGSATVAANISSILNHAADYRDEIESRGERFSDQLAYPFLFLSALGGLWHGAAGAVTMLNAKNTAGVRVGIPLSMLIFLKKAAECGILIKDGRVLELLNEVDTVIFDKTGTLTQSQPHLGNIMTCNGFTADDLLIYAATAESKQSHPIAKAILKAAAERSLVLLDLGFASYQMGFGISAQISGRVVRVGSARFMEMEGVVIPKDLGSSTEQAMNQEVTRIYVSIDGELGGLLEFYPTLRLEARQVINNLRARGLSIYIISGDHEAPTKRLANQLGVDKYFAEILPEMKATIVSNLQQEGRKICFVGDGINDSIALKKANASVSLHGATTIATDTAQTVLMDGTLLRLPDLFTLAKEFKTNSQNTIATSIAPTIFCIGGIIFLKFSLYKVIAIGNISLISSVANSLLPALIHREKLATKETSSSS